MGETADFMRKELFWDCDFKQINSEEHKDIIIQRVVDFGTWDEFLALVEYYGHEVVSGSLMNNAELSERGMYFTSHYFQKKVSEFKCYIKKQSIPIQFSF